MAKRTREPSLILLDIYKDLYFNASPSADFEELLEKTTLGVDNKYDIPYEDYEIDSDLMDSIVKGHLSLYKLTDTQRKTITFSVYLGPSPKPV